MQKNLLNFDHNIRSHEHSEAALLDNPGTLSNLHKKMHLDAEKQLSNLINGGNLPLSDSQAAMKNPYITSIAKAQLGALNYRKKAKKSKGDGLRHDY